VLEALAGIQGKIVEPNYPRHSASWRAERKRALTVVFTT
jgi:hypothetical protein